jgi:hypothetical protein
MAGVPELFLRLGRRAAQDGSVPRRPGVGKRGSPPVERAGMRGKRICMLSAPMVEDLFPTYDFSMKFFRPLAR